VGSAGPSQFERGVPTGGVSGLLPQALRDAIAARGDSGAATSFGVVTLVVLIVLLVEHEVVRVALPGRLRLTPLFVAATALSIAVVLTLAVRIEDLLP
jgi:hypothetical protein